MAFVDAASKFVSDIRVRRLDVPEEVDGKSIMQMLLLAGTMGTVLVIECDGEDERQALDALVRLIASKFDED